MTSVDESCLIMASAVLIIIEETYGNESSALLKAKLLLTRMHTIRIFYEKVKGEWLRMFELDLFNDSARTKKPLN